MKTVYLAGRFRGKTPWEQEQNVRRAEGMALDVAWLGYAFICPHTMTRFYQNSAPDEFWLTMDLELLRRCDVLFVFDPKWELSAGTRGEIAEAQKVGIPIVYTLEELAKWSPTKK